MDFKNARSFFSLQFKYYEGCIDFTLISIPFILLFIGGLRFEV